MNITPRDFWGLCKHQPLLTAGSNMERAEGTLEISAYYDRDVGRVFRNYLKTPTLAFSPSMRED